MNKMKIYIGVPGSGKSTLAFKEAEETGATVIERDIIRKGFYDRGIKWSKYMEKQVTKDQKSWIVKELMLKNDIIISDTNINPKTRKSLHGIAKQFGVEVEQVLVRCPFDDCLKRNESREGRKVVPKDMVKSFYISFTEQFPLRYTPDARLTSTYVFDIDGTIAKNVSRSPYDMTRVSEDLPHKEVIEILTVLAADNNIILLSGRNECARSQTAEWMFQYNVPYSKLIMRADNDDMKDSVLKHDLFNRFIAPYNNVKGVFDDRNQVVSMWRKMGVRCYQVAEGDF